MRSVLGMVWVGLTGCAAAQTAPPATPVTSAGAGKSGPVVTSRAQCLALKGIWRKVGVQQLDACDVPTRDGDKPCRSSDQCESLCVANTDADPAEPVEGHCYASFMTVGTCLSEVSDGRIVRAQCAD
ncbi:hypothetical protein DFR29_1241 [Tahibacter aquaticus]|uniref:Secreted protein n=1 Tax=Tahibacter aquaticus TaxID=520092 RepID=A0A4R6YKP4_9GAMM|nr:hypothetical protein [Tahibacter aquaticus]TDR37704.1 hypothetical protein DFR29_1241 [Tahibacter aquaticus]